MAVTRKCANAIRLGIWNGLGDAEIARKVGVQEQTVRDFRAGRKTYRTATRKGAGGPKRAI